jgi:hypothetical protein
MLKSLPLPGQAVMVRWGHEQANGLVISTQRAGGRPRVRVLLAVLGPDGEELGTESFTVSPKALVGL